MRKKRGIGRKAQLSIFMVLAILIMLMGIVWFVFIDATEKKPQPVAKEVAPLQAFILGCLKDSGDLAMRQIGTTGGYANIPSSIEGNPSAYLQTGAFTSLRQPYWWHDGITSVPPLDFIQKEAERETARIFTACIDNLSAFSRIYDISVSQNPRAEIAFNEKETSLALHYQVRATTKDNSTTLSEDVFSESLPIRFLKIYSLATTLMEGENNDEFIERKAIDLLSLDPANIPLTGFEFDCSPRTWQVTAVRERMQELLSTNLAFIKVKGTSYSTTQYVPNPFGKETFENSYFASHYVWDLGVENFDGLKAGFRYDSKWPMAFNARPNDNGLMKAAPQQGEDILSKVCINIYHFTYDFAFPIKVDVIDETPQQPYVFSFAFTASVDHNQPSRESSGSSLFDSEETIVSEDYCANRDVETTILTVDNVTGDPIRGANITFSCGRFSCGMGGSEWLGLGAAAGIVKQFPRCTNGVLKVNAPGYLPSSQFQQIQTEGKSTLVFLTPIKDIASVTVVKHPLGKIGQEELLGASESAAIVLKANDSSFVTYTTFPSSASLPLQFPMDSGHTYHVSIRLLRNEETIGGYEADWTPSLEQLRDARGIRFHAIAQNGKSEDEDTAFMNALSKHSADVPLPELT